MNKQTNTQETLKRGKGKYKGDEDKLKSSTQNPKKELSIFIINSLERLFNLFLSLTNDELSLRDIDYLTTEINEELNSLKEFKENIINERFLKSLNELENLVH